MTTKFKLGDVVQIRDMTGFADRTIRRFAGRCCVVESVEPGLQGFNAHVRIKGAKPGDEFQAITVKCARLVKIQQLPKGTDPATVMKPKRVPYVQRDGDVFRMTHVRDVDVAGTLLEVLPGNRFKLVKGTSWALEYLDQKQEHLHYTDRDSVWINELIDAGVIELVKPALARAFGPVPVDEWSYNSTTLDGLARSEVAELRSTISDATTGRIMFTHIRKADIGCWVRVNPKAAHALPYLESRGRNPLPCNRGWVFLHYAEEAFRDAAFLTNGNVTYITAFEYPAMRADLEASFSREL